MEVFVRNIGPSVTEHKLKRAIARVLHGLDFSWMQALPINFKVFIHLQQRAGQLRTGILTVPSHEIGQRLLQRGLLPLNTINLDRFVVKFSKGRRQPRPDVVQAITRLPYVDPQALEERALIVKELKDRFIDVDRIQFGWEGREGSFSPEWEKSCVGCLDFDLDKREYRITYADRVISIPSTQITWMAAGVDGHAFTSSCYFHLQYPPSFETEISDDTPRCERRKAAVVCLGS